jgi:endonuclease III related protein
LDKGTEATRLIPLAVIEGFRMNREVEVFRRLLEQYGPQGWWPADSSFEVIVGALLMPQTSWRNVAAAIRNLKAAGLLDVHALAAASIATIRRHVKVAGLYRVKPSRLRNFCRHLLETADGDVRNYLDRPMDVVRRDLLAQEGVGPETADSILLYAGDHPRFLVDAYTIRIGRRIGLFDTTEYKEVQRHFERHVPQDLGTYREYHALLVAHAKALCRPKPRCEACPLVDVCDFGQRGGGARPIIIM